MMPHPTRTLIVSPLAGRVVLCSLSVATLRAQLFAEEGGGPGHDGDERARPRPSPRRTPPRAAAEASRKVTFTKVEGRIRSDAEIRGLTPGEHGFRHP